MTSKLKQASFNLTVDASGQKLDRSFEFADGTHVTFSIPLKNAAKSTLLEIQQTTTDQVIDLLRSTLPPQSGQS